MPKHAVATVDEIPPGQRKVVEVAGRSIGVFNIKGEFFALRNTCPHQGGPLCKGIVSGFLSADVPGEYTYVRRGEMVRCPWHGWEFDIKTGQSWWDPARTRVRTYEVTVEAADIASTADSMANADVPPGYIPGPYTAESYPVSVEKQVVYVEIP
ncbi:MAG: Rieske 2Fe-2S domain-containing protein [Caldilineaceae bacterium]